MQNTIEILEQIQLMVQQTKNNTLGYSHNEIFAAINTKLDAMIMIEEIKQQMAQQEQATL